MFIVVLAMDCNNMSVFLALLFYFYLPVSSSKLTTLPKDKNLTSLEERLASLEETIERRLNATERVLGQLLTRRDNANLKDIDVLALRSGIYMFHWTIATGGSSFSTQLMVAGSVRASNLVPYPGGRDSSSAMVIISVNKEDHVWIQTYGSSVHVYGGLNHIGYEYQSTFSGILLQAS